MINVIPTVKCIQLKLYKVVLTFESVVEILPM